MFCGHLIHKCLDDLVPFCFFFENTANNDLMYSMGSQNIFLYDILFKVYILLVRYLAKSANLNRFALTISTIKFKKMGSCNLNFSHVMTFMGFHSSQICDKLLASLLAWTVSKSHHRRRSNKLVYVSSQPQFVHLT